MDVCNNNDHTINSKKDAIVIIDALQTEYRHMAPWYDTFWKSYTERTLKLPFELIKASIYETYIRENDNVRQQDDNNDNNDHNHHHHHHHHTVGDKDSTIIITVVDVGCGTGTLLKYLFEEYTATTTSTNTNTTTTTLNTTIPWNRNKSHHLFPSLTLIGIEASEEMLQQARMKFVGSVGPDGKHTAMTRRRNNNDVNNNCTNTMTVILQRCPAEQLPLQDNSVHVIISTNAFHFFRNKQQSLDEMLRVLVMMRVRSNDLQHDHDVVVVHDGDFLGGTLVMTDWCNDYFLVRLYHLMERIRWNWWHGFKDAYPAPLSKRELFKLVKGAGFDIVLHTTYRVRIFLIFFWGMQTIVAKKRHENKR